MTERCVSCGVEIPEGKQVCGSCELGCTEVFVRESVLDEAKKIIRGDRDRQYGSPEDSFAVIAKMWTAYLDGRGKLIGEVSAADVGWMMVCFKAARAATEKVPKRDTFVDAAGYAACAAEVSLGNSRVRPRDESRAECAMG